MASDRILVIDAGTSSLRAVRVSADGATELIASEPWLMLEPEDAGPFGREITASALENSLEELIAASEPGGPYAAVATAGQREGVVFADAAAAPVYVSPNIDARAAAEGMLLEAARGAEIYRSTGHLPALMQAPAKLAWLRTHRPDDAGRVARVIPLADWVAARLTGQAAVSRSLGVENGLFDVRSGAPASHLAEIGFDESLLPPVAADGAIAGQVESGRLSGAPVVLAGADTQCALAGLGAVDEGLCGVPAGWSAPLQLVTDEPRFDDQMRTWTGRHVAADLFVLESNASETGRAWSWACELFGLAPHDAALLAASAPIGSHDVTIVLGARAMRASAMSAGIGGVLLPLPLVMSAPSTADVVRAVLESIAYAIRANLEQLEEVSGTRVQSLRLGGGMSRSESFAQIVADVIDRRVEVARTPETTALGAAALAAVGVGLHGTLVTAMSATCRERRVFEPRLRASTAYEDHYAQWCVMANGMERLSGEGL